ncbi:carbonate dehydratase [Pseudoalteromonas sp. MMG024]|uniref:carbonate dehydratase n=1 Tax=Pseudoalteromonas sp. MMG024 TaxID=2909980 RepID=UPI001EFF8D5D|nr:carbonate dehydratase [Pseudoalteromonas sp. MMG024]MCF6456525.1 carbonate dehydratase [Pseudoalteromonas sp. MMG024]
MNKLAHLFVKNRSWAKETTDRDPEFFKILSMQQNPEYLWIGCADSRVPANEIVGLLPGELFVHRNVANMVVHTDHNCLSVLQYAVEVLKVKHIMVVGHYGCGGVKAALDGIRLGLIDNWLRHVVDARDKYETQLSSSVSVQQKFDRLCEINVIEQVKNVCQTNIVMDAWERGQALEVHGWIYGLADGHIRDLETSINGANDVAKIYNNAVQGVFSR